MSATQETIERYIRAWNATDPQQRRALVAETWTEDARYTDPLADAEGHAAIDATIAAVQGMFPGHRFSLAGPVDAHHDIVRFRWHLTAADAHDPLVIGFDVAELEHGRIRRVHGFLDKVPAAA